MATLLVLTVLLPIVGGAVLLVSPGLGQAASRGIALAVTGLTLLLGLVLLGAFETGEAGFQFAYKTGGHLGLPWVEVSDGPGIRFALGLDGISLFLFVLTSLLMITAVFSSWSSIAERTPTYYALLLFLEAGLLGLFASLDVVLFYVFFEFTLIPLFFLVGLYGGPERRRASVTFFLYTLAGSLLTLIGVIALVIVHQQHTPDRILTFSIPELTEGLGGARMGRLAGQADDGQGALGVPADAAGPDLPPALRRVRHQGAALPVPHLAAAGPRRGADGRLGPAGGRPAEGRQLRVPALQSGDDADRLRRPLPVPRDALGRRDHLRGADGPGPDGRQAAGRLQLGQPHGLHRPRPVLDDPGRASTAP